MPMSCIYDMIPWSLRTAITPDTVKIMKNFWHFCVRAWNFLQNGIQNFVFWLIHSWEIALQSQKKALALKGLTIAFNLVQYVIYFLVQISRHLWREIRIWRINSILYFVSYDIILIVLKVWKYPIGMRQYLF